MYYSLNDTFRVRADKPDWRDIHYNFMRSSSPRDVVDLRKWASPIEDQLHLGSCVGQAVVGAYELMINKKYPDLFTDLSRLYVYYNARLLDNMVNEDAGAYTRDGIKAIHKYGICSEDIWPYIINRFSVVPPVECYMDGKKRMIKNYYRILVLPDVIDALNADHPVVISMNIYDSFYDLELPGRSILSMPTANENLIGGHAVTLVGYDIPRQLLLARNSFGEYWGDRGYFWIPFNYFTKDIMDNWIFDIDLLGETTSRFTL